MSHHTVCLPTALKILVISKAEQNLTHTLFSMRLIVRRCCSHRRVLPKGRPQQAQSTMTRSW
ncbi:hypothetical protein L798_08491 [Zootermopsis nevadensis]|uniref:Uncharacterized protein n=1 Tax=Zootermopsis nevadensis TaxID=136037 RepID=A0A067R3J5_ZOONE|nr:hypothetical protein L798_08491 [Zootermopsis nevadensis]